MVLAGRTVLDGHLGTMQISRRYDIHPQVNALTKHVEFQVASNDQSSMDISGGGTPPSAPGGAARRRRRDCQF